MQNYSSMYLLYGICAGGKALFCIMLAQIIVSRSKELSLPGREKNLKTLSNFQYFSVYVCVCICAFSLRMFTDLENLKKIEKI